MTTKTTVKKATKATVSAVKKRSGSEPPDEKICFVISPIGKEGTEVYDKFKDVLDYMIKPAIDTSSLKLKVIRADDINHAGSFIKDILVNILNSYVVIADITNPNPNVFYELGVRHSISPRTILISQTSDSIPSDLKEYRTIVYDSSAKGGKLFQDKLHQYIDDIRNDPQRPDNPVLCHLPAYEEDKTQLLDDEISKLKEELEAVLKGSMKNLSPANRNLSKSLDRILKLKNAELKKYTAAFTRGEGEKKESFTLPVEQGNFKLYFCLAENKSTIEAVWYISVCEKECNIDEELADIRMLIEACSKGQKININFIIATNLDLTDKKKNIASALTHMKTFIPQDERDYFKIDLWDNVGLKIKEKELGIRFET